MHSLLLLLSPVLCRAAMQVHRAVVASGVRFSGPTIHFVDEEYDTGGWPRAGFRRLTVSCVALGSGARPNRHHPALRPALHKPPHAQLFCP